MAFSAFAPFTLCQQKLGGVLLTGSAESKSLLIPS